MEKIFRERQAVLWITFTIVAITVGHYLLSTSMGVTHNILQRLYYAPIIWAAYRYGQKGGILAATLSSILYLPHILMAWSDKPTYQVNQFLELAMFLVIGALTGLLFRQKALGLQLLQSYEKMALFGGLSRAVIRSLKSPIKTLQGMLVSLDVAGRKDAEVGFCVEVMREQIDRVESLRNDLISLVERKKLRLKRQSLQEILQSISSEIAPMLELRFVELTTRFSLTDTKIFCNRKAIIETLSYMTGMMLDHNNSIKQLTLYQGESAENLWIGASVRDVQLGVYFQSSLSVLETDQFGFESLISVVNTMNNHFGAVKFRRKHQRLVEFVLVFPKKLKIPWNLIDTSEEDKTAQTDGPNNSDFIQRSIISTESSVSGSF